jgi:outer membrane protein assembly factor BamB
MSIVLADGKVFLLDKAMTQAQKDQATAERIAEQGAYVDNLGAAITPAPRLIVALNADTGAVAWTYPRDVADCVVGDAAGVPMMMHKDKTLLVCGTPYSEDHHQPQYAAGDYARRAIGAFDSQTGAKLWGGAKNYMTRPIIFGDFIYAEPWGYEIRTGAYRASKTGGIWQNYRGYAGNCGGSIASADTLFNRGGVMRYYDLPSESGILEMNAGIRPDCWPNYVVANGLLVTPAAGKTCICPYALQESATYIWNEMPLEPPSAVQPVQVEAVKLFYNNSKFDGADVNAVPADDNAIATDKSPLLPGQTASFANYSGYVRGINGIMIDLTS